MIECKLIQSFNPQDVLQAVLRSTHDRSLNKYAAVDEEDDFQEVLDPPPIAAATQYQVGRFPVAFLHLGGKISDG